jgi:transcriptional regulator with XRE-family HTH domain
MNKQEKQQFGQRLKNLRRDLGYSVQKVASMVNAGRSSYQNWECGERSPNEIIYFQSLAVALGTTRDYLMGFTDHQGVDVKVSDYITAKCHKEQITNKNAISESVAFHFQCLSKNELNERKIILLKVSDDSMNGDLSKGDDVLIDLTAKTVSEPNIYAIQDNSGKIWFRWIRKNLSGKYTLYANNKEHSSDQELNETEFQNLDLLGCVAWVGHWRVNT